MLLNINNLTEVLSPLLNNMGYKIMTKVGIS